MAGLLGVPSGNLHTNRVWCAVLLVAPLVFWAPSGPAAREIATREPLARSGRSRSPPWPSGPSGALRTGGACVAVCGGASPRSPARPCRRPWVPQPGPPTPWPCCFVACGTAGVLAPSGPAAWPGCLVCPWAAARPRAVRAASFARRVGAKPGQAPPPPTGSAAWPSGAQALLFCCLWHRWCSGAVGPGRPRDRHTRAFGSEWSISKPALALRTLRRPPHWRRLCRCVWWSFPSKLGHAPPPARSPHASLRLGVVDLEARPCPPDPPAPSTPAALARLCVASKPGQALPPPMGAAARLSGPSGTLHAGGGAGICN